MCMCMVHVHVHVHVARSRRGEDVHDAVPYSLFFPLRGGGEALGSVCTRPPSPQASSLTHVYMSQRCSHNLFSGVHTAESLLLRHIGRAAEQHSSNMERGRQRLGQHFI